MADRKISDLTALTAPASGDFLPIVDISEAAAATKNKRITIEELMRGMPDGTAAAPGIAFENDPNTGIYSPGADQLAVATNGTGRLFVDATGNVGVGTASPTSFGAGAVMQSIVGTTAYGGYLGFTNNVTVQLWADESGLAGHMGTRTNHPLIATTNNIEKLRITSAGNVGIGTSSPSAALDVVGSMELGTKGASNTTTYLDITSDTTYTDYGFRIIRGGTANGNTQLISRGTGALELNCVDGGYLGFSTSNIERVRIDSSGNVGIGTSSPGALLHVVSETAGNPTLGTASGGLFLSSSNSLYGLYGGVNGATGNVWLQAMRNNSATAYDILLNPVGGRVGIGTTSPSEKLNVIGNIQVGDSGNERGIYVGAAGFSGAFLYQPSGDVQLSPRSGFGIKFAPAPGSATEWGRWDSSGRLLVGTSTARGNFKIGPTLYDAAQQLEAGSQGFQSFVGGSPSASGPYLMLAHQRSGTVGGNTVLISGDEMGTVSFHGGDGTNLVIGAAIKGEVDGTPGANDMPGRLVFSVTADGAASPTEALRIKSTRIVNIANTPVHADNAAAKTAGLVDGDVYRKSDGTMMIVFT